MSREVWLAVCDRMHRLFPRGEQRHIREYLCGETPADWPEEWLLYCLSARRAALQTFADCAIVCGVSIPPAAPGEE